MRRSDAPPFFAGELVVGTVRKLYRCMAELDVRGWQMPLNTGLMSWGELKHSASMLEIGQRLEVMVLSRNSIVSPDEWKRSRYSGSQVEGYWISRLPLLKNPWPELAKIYPDGSVIEVEFVEYDFNGSQAFVKLSEEILGKVSMIQVLHRSRFDSSFPIQLLPGETIRVMVHGKFDFGYWLRPLQGWNQSAKTKLKYTSQDKSEKRGGNNGKEIKRY